LRFSIEESNSEKLIDMLLKQYLDIILFHKYLGCPEIESEMIYHDSITLVVNKTFPIIKRLSAPTSLSEPGFIEPSVLQEQLQRHHYLYADINLSLTNVISDYLNVFKIHPMKPLPAKNIITVLNLVAKGGGFAFLPNQLLNQYPAKDELAYLQISKKKIDWDLYIAYNPSSLNFKSVQTAYELIKDYYSTSNNPDLV
jgi:DNA-binding transcriptional LysR family regulator